MNTTTAAQKIETLFTEALADPDREGLTFGPIIVEAMKDHDGDDYFNICAVYDGDLSLLGAERSLLAKVRAKRHMEAMGLPHYPVTVFAERNEWQNANRQAAVNVTT